MWANVTGVAALHVRKHVYLARGAERRAQTQMRTAATRLLTHAPPFPSFLPHRRSRHHQPKYCSTNANLATCGRSGAPCSRPPRAAFSRTPATPRRRLNNERTESSALTPPTAHREIRRHAHAHRRQQADVARPAVELEQAASVIRRTVEFLYLPVPDVGGSGD